MLGACSGGGRRAGGNGGAAARATGPGRPVVIGVVTPLSGPYASVGRQVVAALDATTRHIATDLGGAVRGYHPVVVTADAPLTVTDGQQAYARLRSRSVDAVVWCGAAGLAETVPAIVADLLPVIAVGTDLQARAATDPRIPDLTSPDAAGFPVFQLGVATADAFDVLAAYAAADRGFARSAIVWRASDPGADVAWAKACARHGLDVVLAPSVDTSGGPPDLRAVAAALRGAAAQFVVVLGAAPDAAALVTALDAVGGRYIDTPSARGGAFGPMVAGVAPATGTMTFPTLAGAHAAKGTIAVAALGAAMGLPTVPIRDWLARFVSGYGPARGGEDGPADAIAALLSAAGAARSTAGADLVAAMEAGGDTAFGSAVPVGFAPGRHVAPRRGDVALLTLESLPETRYDLGQEWGTVYRPGDRTADLLVDPTLANNRAAHPELMADIVGRGYGISAQPAYQGGDLAKIAACRAIH